MRHPVPAVRLIITDGGGRVLLLKRGEARYAPGGWCLPGGKVDYGETAEEAAAKELMEETSLRLISSSFLFYQDSLPPRDGDMHCVNLYFEGRASGKVCLNSESVAHAWVGPDDAAVYDIVFGNDLALERYWNQKSAPLQALP